MIKKRVLYILLSFTILLTMNLPTFADTSDGGAISAITLNTPANLTQYYNAMERVDFTATPIPSTGADLSAISWYVNDVPQGITGTAFAYTPTYVGTYEVSAKVTGTPSVMASKTITVSAATVENTLLALSFTPVGGSESVNLLGSTYPAFTYRVTLAAADTAVPTINYFKKDPDSQVVVQNAAAIPGTTTVVVSGAAGTTPKTYTILWDNSGDFQYTTNGGVSTVTGYTGSSGTVTIPDVIGGKFVTVIGQDKTYGYEQVNSLIFPNSAEEIASYAFTNCSNLKTIILPPNLKKIGESAFSGCASLTKVTISHSVTDIGLHAFEHCTALTDIYADKNSADYSSQNGVLFDKTKTALVQYPRGKSETQYTIPSGVRDIEILAFSNCANLITITLPNSVINVKEAAFLDCKLDSVVLSNSLVDIGNSAFAGCSNLVSIAIPSSVTSIGSGAFSGCSSLATVSLENGVLDMGSYAYSNCIQLKTITIPKSVKTIGDHPFYGCTSLTEIGVDANNPYYCSDNGVLYNKAKTVLVQYPCKKGDASYVIPEGVISIGAGAFAASDLTALDIADSVTEIGDSAFSGCKFASLTIPDGVTKIGYAVFARCTNLGYIDFPESVVSIGGKSFQNCDSLISLTIPGSVNEILSCAFYDCDNLTTVIIQSGVTTIGESAFSACPKLTSVTIPSTVTSIGDGIFWGADKAKLTLYCDAGSAAEAYAIANSYLYQATPATPAALTKTYTAGLKLSDVALPAGYAWTQPDTLLTVPGGSYPAVYTPTDAGQSPVTMDLAVTVSKANPAVTFPTISAVTYTKNLKLSDIALPTGFAWELPAKTLSAPGGSYKVTYTPTDTANYNTITQNVTVTVNNASQNTPKLKVMSRTEDTIIIQAVSGAEYAIKLRSSSTDPIYGSSNKFTSLNDDTQYTVYIRMAGKLNYDPSPAESATVRTEESTGVRRPTVKIVGGDSWPKDIGEVAWAQGYIEDVLKRGIMVGSANPDGTVSFKPGDTATRAEFATALYKYMGKKEYAYVPYDDTKDHWAIEYISRLTKDGIMTGTGGNLFEPDEAITREQIATILNRAFKPAAFVSDYRYVDHGAISDWAFESVYQVYGAGWMSGDETGTFRPDDTATRAEIAAIFSRLAAANVR